MSHTAALRAFAPTAPASRTGGPDDDGHGSLREQIAGWGLVVLAAMLVTFFHLL
jgi:hypothetical protein